MTVLPMLFATSIGAHAASLDLIEVGGAFGSPGATNPTALWWNPAGLAVGGGTQFLLEGAPTFARVTAQRDNPNYGEVVPPSADYPSDYDYGGTDQLSYDGVVPFLGVSSDFTLDGLGVGIGLAVPNARGGTLEDEWGTNRFALRDGGITSLQLIAGASYQIKNLVAIGVSGALVDSSYFANTDTTIYPDVAEAARVTLGFPEAPTSYQDGYVENPGYTSTLVFGGEQANGEHGALKDQAFTFGLGVYVTPIADKLGISLAYNHGFRLDHEGDLTMKFQCPPAYDLLSNLGATQQGLCDATFQGKGSIGYDMPGRVHLGVVVSPVERVRVELMGAYVMWSAFTDFDITTDIAADQVLIDDPVVAAATADLVSKTRPWARNGRDTFWVALDGKFAVHRLFTTGARVTYDRSAIPTDSISANNYDANALILSGTAMLTPVPQLGVGLSFGHQFLAARNVTNSVYAVNVAQGNANAPDYYASEPSVDRLFYPSTNGTYTGSINRLGIVLKGQFGASSRL